MAILRRLWNRKGREATDVDRLKAAAARFGASPERLAMHLDSVTFSFCLVRVCRGSSSELARCLSEVVEIAHRTGAEVSQVLGDRVLVLFDVPIQSSRWSSVLDECLQALAGKLPEIQVIARMVQGLYGPIGYSERQVITAVSEELTRDMIGVSGLEPGIFVDAKLMELLPSARDYASELR